MPQRCAGSGSSFLNLVAVRGFEFVDQADREALQPRTPPQARIPQSGGANLPALNGERDTLWQTAILGSMS